LCFPARLCLPDLCLAAEDLCFAPTDTFLDMAEARCFAANDGVADRHSPPVNASRQTAAIKPTLRGIMITLAADYASALNPSQHCDHCIASGRCRVGRSQTLPSILPSRNAKKRTW